MVDKTMLFWYSMCSSIRYNSTAFSEDLMLDNIDTSTIVIAAAVLATAIIFSAGAILAIYGGRVSQYIADLGSFWSGN